MAISEIKKQHMGPAADAYISDFRMCAPIVRTFFQPNIIAISELDVLNLRARSTVVSKPAHPSIQL